MKRAPRDPAERLPNRQGIWMILGTGTYIALATAGLFYFNLRQSYLRDRIGVLLGGRASEQLIFGEVSSGAADDLKQATQLARHMVTHWGMSDELGPVTFRRGEEHIFLGREMTQQRDFSEHIARIIDEEICSLVKTVEKEVASLLKEHRPQLESLAEALLDKETLGADDIQSIIGKETNTMQ